MKKRCGCGCEDFIGIEYSYNHKEHYDGISEWKCRKCHTRYGRWTGRILKDGESEKRYGGKK